MTSFIATHTACTCVMIVRDGEFSLEISHSIDCQNTRRSNIGENMSLKSMKCMSQLFRDVTELTSEIVAFAIWCQV